MNSFATSVLSVLLGWMRSLASGFWTIVSSQDGVSGLTWIGDHWLMLVVVLCAIGTVVDFTVWMLRWRPYYVWRSAFRRGRGQEEAPRVAARSVKRTARPVKLPSVEADGDAYYYGVPAAPQEPPAYAPQEPPAYDGSDWEYPADEYPSDEYPADERPADDYLADEALPPPQQVPESVYYRPRTADMSAQYVDNYRPREDGEYNPSAPDEPTAQYNYTMPYYRQPAVSRQAAQPDYDAPQSWQNQAYTPAPLEQPAYEDDLRYEEAYDDGMTYAPPEAPDSRMRYVEPAQSPQEPPRRSRWGSLSKAVDALGLREADEDEIPSYSRMVPKPNREAAFHQPVYPQGMRGSAGRENPDFREDE